MRRADFNLQELREPPPTWGSKLRRGLACVGEQERHRRITNRDEGRQSQVHARAGRKRGKGTIKQQKGMAIDLYLMLIPLSTRLCRIQTSAALGYSNPVFLMQNRQHVHNCTEENDCRQHLRTGGRIDYQ
jgi:hypothetical protein